MSDLILPTDEDRRTFEEYQETGKYDSPLAVAMERIWMEGDEGDAQYGSTAVGSLAVLYDRQVFITDSQGFVSAYTFRNADQAAEYARMFHPIEPEEYQEESE